MYANKCAFKTRDKVDKNNKRLTDKEIKQLIVCLDNAIYKEDRVLISENQRCKLIEYNYNLQYKLYELLGIEYNELLHTINIDTLEIKKDV